MKTNQLQKNIPDGWRRVMIGELGVIVTGNTPPMKEIKNYFQGVHCWATAEDFKSKYIFDTRIKLSAVGKLCSRVLPEGSVLVTCIASIGKNAIASVPLSTNQQINAIVVNKKHDNEFVYYLIENSESILKKFAGTSAVAILNKNDFSKIKLNIPPLPEQKRIVSVLEAWDQAIEKLGRKIEVKKNIKKGLMQNLLTGKVHLAGFSDKWNVKKLGDLCDIGTGKKNNQDKIKDGQYPFFVRSPHIERINSYSYNGEAILVPGEGNIGKIFHYIDGKFDFHQRVYKISDFKSSILGKFVYFYLVKNFSKSTKSDSVKATVDSLRLPTFTNFKIHFPSINEQKEIVNVLTTADEEIEMLQKKLAVIKDQKKYLLNNLITGTLRTPETLRNNL